jgi:hypothetical protein
VAVDRDGNVWVSGFWEGDAIDLGGGAMRPAGVHDLFLGKFDRDGTLRWAKRYGDAEDQVSLALQAHPRGGVVATGWFRGAVDFGAGALRSYPDKATFVARLDTDGKPLWSKRFGRISDYATTSAALDASGDVLVSGGSDKTLDFGGGASAKRNDLGPVLVAFDEAGKRLSARRFGDGMDNLDTAVRVDATGDVVLAGTFKHTVDFGAGPLRPIGREAIYVAKLDPSGRPRWAVAFGGALLMSLAGVLVDGAGNVYVAGQLEQGSLDFGLGALPCQHIAGYVAKLDPSGKPLWNRLLDHDPMQWISAIAFDPQGRLVVAGAVARADPQRSTMHNNLFLTRLAP